MSNSSNTEPDPAVKKGLSFLRTIFRDHQPRNFAVRLWDGTTWAADANQRPLFTLVLNHEGSLRKMFRPPLELSLGESYIFGDFDIEGDIQDAFNTFDPLLKRKWEFADLVSLGARFLALSSGTRGSAEKAAPQMKGKTHSRERDRQAISYHYDRSNDFYKAWLDQRMIYSCAYFDCENESLDTAQERKLDYICRKLRLKPGEKLLDIGSGWGGLILHAARKYAVEALGITLSREQAEWTKTKIMEAKLESRCRVERLDYRDITDWGSFDKMASVGMFEHVGISRLMEYFARAARLLKPGGTFLNHGIAKNVGDNDESRFIDRYIFPDGELVDIGNTVATAERAGFEVRDLESLREHYALTLRNWVRRLEDNCAEACQAAGEISYRLWRLYMSGCAHEFQNGSLNVYQMLLVKQNGGQSGLPLTRCDWYK